LLERSRKQELRKTTPPRDSQLEDVNVRANEQSKKKRKFAKRTTVVGMDPVALGGSQGGELPYDQLQSTGAKPKGKLLRLSQRKRIFAKKVARKCHRVSDRLSNHLLATPIRLAMLILGGCLVVAWPHWLPWLLVLFAMVYVSWLLMRSWAGQSEIERLNRLSRKTGVSPAAVREWFEKRPPTDRFTQWLGSILLGVFSCVALSLFGLSVWNSMSAIGAGVEAWAFYTWLLISCMGGCTLVLCCGNWWVAQVETDFLQRRLVMLGIGLVTGVISIVAANVFEVDLTFSNFSRQPSNSMFSLPLPVVPAWLLFYVGLFGLFRWWEIADPVRQTRLRVWDVGVCVIVAAALTQILNLPMVHGCMVAAVVSVSVQLASTWISHPDRELACLGTKQSKVAG